MRRTSLVTLLTLFGICPVVAEADLVLPGTLPLTAASATENRLTLEVYLGAPGGGGIFLGSDTTDLSGSTQIDVRLDGTNNPISIEFLSGSMSGSYWEILGVPGVGDITGTNTGATISTASPPGLSTVTGGVYPAAEQQLIVNQGTVEVGPGVATIDLSSPPIVGSGTGNGSLAVTPTGNPNEFTVRTETPILFAEQVIDSPAVFLQVSGTVVSQGTLAAVPEPSAGLLLLLVACIGGGVKWCRLHFRR